MTIAAVVSAGFMEIEFSFRTYNTNCQKCSGRYVNSHLWRCLVGHDDLKDSLPRLDETDERPICPHCPTRVKAKNLQAHIARMHKPWKS